LIEIAAPGILPLFPSELSAVIFLVALALVFYARAMAARGVLR
jgi:hypothetical protein